VVKLRRKALQTSDLQGVSETSEVCKADDVRDVGAIIVATGYRMFAKDRLAEYGGGQCADVVDALEFEAMLTPPGGLRRPSDGKPPREVVFIQCAGSRDPEHGVPYCSKICCMVTAKQAMMLRQRAPDSQAYVFYIDIRSPGKGNDEFVQQAMAAGVFYLRGKASRVFSEGGKVVVWGADTLSGRAVEIAADLVVLATPMVPATGAADLARRLHIAADSYGFYSEAHPKLRPVESLTAGVYLAGAGQAPKDIPESIAQAGGAAAKVLALFSRDTMVQEPTVAYVVEELCAACGQCVAACPYGARQLHAWKRYATVNEALCQGCGACVVACPNKASQVRNSALQQIVAMADALM
jgi:heterodisulfide reductase subunit A